MDDLDNYICNRMKNSPEFCRLYLKNKNWTIVYCKPDIYNDVIGISYYVCHAQTARAARQKHKQLLRQGINSLGIRCTKHGLHYASWWFAPDDMSKE